MGNNNILKFSFIIYLFTIFIYEAGLGQVIYLSLFYLLIYLFILFVCLFVVCLFVYHAHLGQVISIMKLLYSFHFSPGFVLVYCSYLHVEGMLVYMFTQSIGFKAANIKTLLLSRHLVWLTHCTLMYKSYHSF